jgi:LuxR family maltose regulon positive regulatory protein
MELLLNRPRLDKLFEKAMTYPVLLVQAGAGWGKTQAAYSFMSGCEAETVWVQLSPEDNLNWRFWEHYAGAIGRYRGDTGRQLAELGFPETIRQFDRYVSLVYEKTEPRKKLVTLFDDFHLIRDPAILLFFRRLLTIPLPHAAITLISRTEPALNLAPLLSRGNLAEITTDELRFNTEETALLFQARQIPLTDAELARISQDTDGWALAVDLVARDMETDQGKGCRPFFSGSVKKIGEDIFNTLEQDRQRFLVKLSLIDYWPLDLLELFPAARPHMEEMAAVSAFVRYDAYMQGYRIHHLFLEFLREKQEKIPREEVREVYSQAAGWCKKNHLRLDAAAYYEQAGDYQGLLQVIDSLPRIPPLRVAAFLLDIVNRAAASPEPSSGGGEDLLFLQYVVRAKLLMCLGRFEESEAQSGEALRRFEPLPAGPLRSRILLGACINMGILQILTCRYTKNYNWQPWFERAYGYYGEYPNAPQKRISQNSLVSYVIQVGYPAGPGELEAAVDTAATAVTFTSAFLNGFLAGAGALAKAELAYYQGDLARAEEFARQAVLQGRENKQYEVENRGLFYLLRLCIHSGNIEESRELRRRLEAQLEIPDYLNRYTIHDIGMGRFYAQIGLTGKIAPWIRNEYEEGDLNALFHNFNVLVRAWCLFAEKDYAAAAAALSREEDRRYLESFLLGKLEITILEAAIRFHQGDEPGALALLKSAWEMAAPNSLEMPFIELGEDMRLLVETALGRIPRQEAGSGEIPRDWLEGIKNQASAYSKKLASVVEQYLMEETEGEKPPVYLTVRERKVLSGLARGLNREDIAREAGLSLNTVKGVIRVIYDKLGAVNRADAVRIALDRKILKSQP